MGMDPRGLQTKEINKAPWHKKTKRIFHLLVQELKYFLSINLL